jgi:hypothetical protein
MVKTKSDVKLHISEWIEKQEEPFSTQQVREELLPVAPNIHLAPNRLAKFIQGTGKADYDNSRKLWSRRIRVQ